jgi:hypothetical protein
MSARIWLDELRSIPDPGPSASVEPGRDADAQIPAGDQG